jgi:hypothetical protein
MKLFAQILIAALLLIITAKRADAAPVIQIANEVSLPRLNSEGNPVQKRALLMNPEAVSRQDCDDDQRIRFTLLLSGFEANGVLRAWVSTSGQSCGFETARTGQAPACWRAFPSDIPLQSTVDVDIPVRNLMSGVPPFSPSNPISDKSVCGKVDQTTLSVHFLYFAPGTTDTATVMKLVSVEVDTVGPSPRPSAPSSISRTSDAKTVQVISPDAPKPAEAFRVFCKPIDTSAVAACPSFAPQADFVPDAAFESQFECERGLRAPFGSSSPSASNDGFEKEGASFAFALAKVDILGNVSSLSDPKCVTLEAPQVATGAADDGGCNVSSRDSSRASTPWWAVLVLLACVGLRIRTARGSSAARPSSSRPS